jgi:hypothetical protein
VIFIFEKTLMENRFVVSLSRQELAEKLESRKAGEKFPIFGWSFIEPNFF